MKRNKAVKENEVKKIVRKFYKNNLNIKDYDENTIRFRDLFFSGFKSGEFAEAAFFNVFGFE